MSNHLICEDCGNIRSSGVFCPKCNGKWREVDNDDRLRYLAAFDCGVTTNEVAKERWNITCREWNIGWGQTIYEAFDDAMKKYPNGPTP